MFAVVLVSVFMYWRRTTKAGAYAGMLSGLALAVTLFFALGPANSPIAAAIAMLVPFAVVPLVSVMTKAPSEACVRKAFDGVTSTL